MEGNMTQENDELTGTHYQIDEERKVIIYDPQDNHLHKWDYKLENSTTNMAMIAEREGMTVEATFNGTTFQVRPGMTAEEGEKAFEKARKAAWEAYKKTPEYKAKEEARKAKEAAERAQKIKDDELIKDEVLNVEGFKIYFDKQVENNYSGKFGKSIIDYADRWGRVMQAEMKRQGLDHLTEEIVSSTEFRTDIYGMSGASASFARNLLLVAWKHGDEMAKFVRCPDNLKLFKATHSDKAIDFYNNYKAKDGLSFEEQVAEGGKVIAGVLKSEDLIKDFYSRFSDPAGFSEKDVQEYIPVLKLPDNDWRTLHSACAHALKIIDGKSNVNVATKAKTNE